MPKSSDSKPRKKTAFVPRLAYGCVGVGLGVIPLLAATGCNDTHPPPIGIMPYVPDASSDAPTVGIVPAFSSTTSSSAESSTVGTSIPDASSDAPTVGIVPYVPDASSGVDAPTVGIMPALQDAGTASTTDASEG